MSQVTHLKYFLEIVLDGPLTPPALQDMEVAVGGEAAVKSPASSVEQFTPRSARLSRNAREVFFNKMTGEGNGVNVSHFEMKNPVPQCWVVSKQQCSVVPRQVCRNTTEQQCRFQL